MNKVKKIEKAIFEFVAEIVASENPAKELAKAVNGTSDTSLNDVAWDILYEVDTHEGEVVSEFVDYDPADEWVEVSPDIEEL